MLALLPQSPFKVVDASHGGCSCLRLMLTQAVQAGAVRRPVHLPVAVEADAAIPGGCTT